MIAVGRRSLDQGREVARRRVVVGERALERRQVGAGRLDEAIDVEQPRPGARRGRRHPVVDHRRRQQLGDADRRAPPAEEQEALVGERAARDLERTEDAAEGDGRGALDVVVEAAHAVAVAGQQGRRVGLGEVLELDAGVREDLLHGEHELLQEVVVGIARQARLAEPEVERVGEQLLVVRPDVEHDRQRQLGRHAGARGVQGQLADRDAHAVGPEVTQPEDPLAVRDDDEAHLVLGPVAQDLAPAARRGWPPGTARAGGAGSGRTAGRPRPPSACTRSACSAPGRTSGRGRTASRRGPAAPSSARTGRWPSVPGRAGGRRARTWRSRLSMPSGRRPTSPSSSRSAAVNAVDLFQRGSRNSWRPRRPPNAALSIGVATSLAAGAR